MLGRDDAAVASVLKRRQESLRHLRLDWRSQLETCRSWLPDPKPKGKAQCDSCHIPPTFTDVLAGTDPSVPFLHAPEEIGVDAAYAERSATKFYRTTPLRALWQHPPYFHDGSAGTLIDVVNHYDSLFGLRLTATQKTDLVEYLKTL